MLRVNTEPRKNHERESRDTEGKELKKTLFSTKPIGLGAEKAYKNP